MPLRFKVENRKSFTKYTKAHTTFKIKITEYTSFIGDIGQLY